jgi:ATP-dependent DNA helicase RecQ
MAKGRDSIDSIARALGFRRLRPGQREAVEALLSGKDTLAVMPTGSGKSAIYQIAGRLISGPTVVISPLIALQTDQVESLEGSPAGEAAETNSTVPAEERRKALKQFADGGLEFLFLAPEQFANPETLQNVLAGEPTLFVVDEAHCVSSWGHDFRPAYLRLGAVVDALGHPPVLALTATASPPVREEIVDQLHMKQPETVVRGSTGRTSTSPCEPSPRRRTNGPTSWRRWPKQPSRGSSTWRRGRVPRRWGRLCNPRA